MTRRFIGSFDMRALETNWRFEPSPIAARVRVKRAQSWLTGRGAPPAFKVIATPFPAARWNVLFLFSATGELDLEQREMLARFGRFAAPLLVVLAAPRPGTQAERDAAGTADALILKGKEGFDFSAYHIALQTLAEHSSGTVAYVQNDSVFGPLEDIQTMVRRAPWDLTGFIGMRAVENHVSSFAFILRGVTAQRLAALREVLSPEWSCDRFEDVILLQETRLARIAARSMSVGAYWYARTQPHDKPLLSAIARRVTGTPPLIDVSGDPLIAQPLALLEAGFPFLKRSLFNKFAGLHDPALLRAALGDRGWPQG